MFAAFSWICAFPRRSHAKCMVRQEINSRAGSQPRIEPLEGRVVPSTNYTVIDLGTLGGRGAEAAVLNNQGEVVGSSETSHFTTRAFLDIHGKMTSLGSLLGGPSIATSINNKGQVVGSSSNEHGSASQAFVYSNGRVRPIIGKLPGTLPNHQVRPLIINDRDQIIGFATSSGNALVHSGGRLHDIGSLNGLGSVAEGINDQGAIVGYSNLTPFHDIFDEGIQHAFLYQNGQMTDLGTLGGSYSTATAINNHGDVVGFSGTTGDLSQDVFLYHNGAMTDLGSLGGAAASPTAINDKGQVVGWSDVSGKFFPDRSCTAMEK